MDRSNGVNRGQIEGMNFQKSFTLPAIHVQRYIFCVGIKQGVILLWNVQTGFCKQLEIGVKLD